MSSRAPGLESRPRSWQPEKALLLQLEKARSLQIKKARSLQLEKARSLQLEKSLHAAMKTQ